MAKKQTIFNANDRYTLAWVILLISTFAIIGLAVFIVAKNPDEAKDIFNVILPVFSSWVGTILAFYFGRENFESANQQVRELVEKLTPDQRAKAPVSEIMRRFREINYLLIGDGKNEGEVKLSELSNLFVKSDVSRLPVIDFEEKPKYIIHESRLDKYLASGGNQEATLEKFITNQKEKGFGFGLNEGFVLVSEQTSIAEAKRLMNNTNSCQDIFITKEGSPDEPLTGWISNVRMAKFLEA
ncbi:MAG: hypothetical protein AB4372_23795 [Xenococcus sp. (in: cyanobacteria)]